MVLFALWISHVTQPFLSGRNLPINTSVGTRSFSVFLDADGFDHVLPPPAIVTPSANGDLASVYFRNRSMTFRAF